jgi:hypothetical protein
VKRSLLGILLLAILSVTTFAVPNQLTYSGRLLQNGALVNSTLAMTFKLWTDLTAGSLLWATSNITVPVNQGIYSVVLDQVSPNVFVTDNAYLEVIIDPQGSPETLVPRTKINSVGYALQAGGLTTSGGGSAAFVSANGNVGIGTTNPYTKVQIQTAGTNGVQDALALNNPSAYGAGSGTAASALLFTRTRSFDGTHSKMAQIIGGNENEQTSALGYLAFGTTDGALVMQERLRINGSGSVGIGATAPTAKLQVWNSTSNALLVETRPTEGATVVQALFVSPTGNVGIGTSVPVTNLDIYSASGSALKIGTPVGPAGSIRQTLVALESSLGSYTTSIVDSNKILFRGAGYSGAPQDTGAIVAQSQQGLSGLNARGFLKFQVNNDSTGLSDAMTIAFSGNVGIGTTAPGAKLTVAGTTAGNGAAMEINNHITRSGSHTATGSNIRVIRLPGAVGTFRVIARHPGGSLYTTQEYRVINGGWIYSDASTWEFTLTASKTRGGGVTGFAASTAEGGFGAMDINITAPSGTLIYWSYDGLVESLPKSEE